MSHIGQFGGSSGQRYDLQAFKRAFRMKQQAFANRGIKLTSSPDERAVQAPAAQAVIQTERGTAEPTQFIYGRAKCQGTIVFAHQTTELIPLTPLVTLTATVLHQFIAFANHEVEEIEEVYFDDDLIPLENDGTVTPNTKYHNWAWVNKLLGADGQTADTDMIAALGGKWTSSDRLRGIAGIYVRLIISGGKFANGQAPNITAVIKGRKVFDPRSHTTAYSALSPLCLRDYLYNQRFGMQTQAHYSTGTVTMAASVSVVGAGTAWLANVKPGDQFDVVGDGTWTRVQSVESDTALTLVSTYIGSIGSGKSYAISAEFDELGVVTAANISDDAISLAAGGTEARYECSGQFLSTTAPGLVIESMRQSMAGEVTMSGGKWIVIAGSHVTPTITLTDDDMAGPAVITERRSRTEIFNRLRGVFISEPHRWTRRDLPSYSEAGFVTEDNGEFIDSNVFFPMVPSFARAQRLMKIMTRRNRSQVRATLTCKPTAMRLRVGSGVNVTNAREGWTAKSFKVTGVTITFNDDDGLMIILKIVSSAAADYAWSAEETALRDLDALVNGANSRVSLPAVVTNIKRREDGQIEDADDEGLDDGEDTTIFDLAVHGLELANNVSGSITEFLGNSPIIKWRDNSLTDISEASGATLVDKNFKDWEIVIYGMRGQILRVDHTTFPFYRYVMDFNRSDHLSGEPDRVLAFKVYTRSNDGQITRYPALIVVENKAPGQPASFTLEGIIGGIKLKDLKVTIRDPDAAGLVIHASESSGFTPDDSNRVYAGQAATVEWTAKADTTFFVKIAIYDDFGYTGVNFSDEIEIKTDPRKDLGTGNVVWDLETLQWLFIDLSGGNVSLSCKNFRKGAYFLTVIQSGDVGGGVHRTLTYQSASFGFPSGGSPPDHSAGDSGQKDIVTFICDGVIMDGVAQIDFKAAT